MTLCCWARGILARWHNPAASLLAPLLACSLSLHAQTLENLVRPYRESPTPARKAALLRFAANHPKEESGALALLAAGATEVEQGDYELGLPHLEAAGARLPQLADYIAFYTAQGLIERNDPVGAIRSLRSVLSRTLTSPLCGRASLLASSAYLLAKTPQEAVSILKANYARLPQPDGDLALGVALESAGELALAAAYGQRVYFDYPAARQASDAQELLNRLKAKLGQDYPPPTPVAMLGRAGKLLDAGDFRRARSEYESLALQLGGPQRELAQVRAGRARYLAGSERLAYTYLQALRPSSPEADAERLYYLVQCARGLDEIPEMLSHVEELNSLYTGSPWRLSALVWAANYYLLQNDSASYVPLYRACYASFPESPQASYCHWKVAWDAYIHRRDEALDLLHEHLDRFPESDKRPAALYFLGRLAEAAGNPDQAREYYTEIRKRFPNNYYVALAEARLGASVVAPQDAALLNFDPIPQNQLRIARSRLLASAGLTDWADGELRFAAREHGQPALLAMELARQADARNAPDQALRYIKAVFPSYLSTPLDAAPDEMWRLAFPLPFRQPLERYSRERGIDLYLLAGLIRQESEFNNRAVSRAGAVGLMQILPSTGRQLSRTLRMGRFRNSLLFEPDYNVRLGTYHFRSLEDDLNGSEEAVLAAYNAGKLRADEWLTWASYREPAEFVESIPFSETRTYVMAVLRNAWMYRLIYASHTR